MRPPQAHLIQLSLFFRISLVTLNIPIKKYFRNLFVWLKREKWMIILYPTGFNKHNVLISIEQELRAACPSEYTKAYFTFSLLTLSFLYRTFSFLGHSHSSPFPSPFTPATILLKGPTKMLSTPLETVLLRRVRFLAICSPHLPHSLLYILHILFFLSAHDPFDSRDQLFLIFVFPEPEYSRCPTNTE